MKTNEDEILRTLSILYAKFLFSNCHEVKKHLSKEEWDLFWNNGLKEIRTKFLTNAYLGILKKKNSKARMFESEKFVARRSKSERGIVEHAVPKTKYIQSPAESLATKCENEDNLREKIFVLLKKFWYVCKITKDEDKILTKLGLSRKMPNDWNETASPFARYEVAKIKVIKCQT